jgi:hypothetical protein
MKHGPYIGKEQFQNGTSISWKNTKKGKDEFVLRKCKSLLQVSLGTEYAVVN